MQQKSNDWSEMNFSPIFHWISDIGFNFFKLLILRTKQLKFSEHLDWNSFQISDLTFVASEFKILFLLRIYAMRKTFVFFLIIFNQTLQLRLKEECSQFQHNHSQNITKKKRLSDTNR